MNDILKILPDGLENPAPKNPHKGDYGTSDRQDHAAGVQEILGQGLFDQRSALEKIAEDAETANTLPTV